MYIRTMFLFLSFTLVGCPEKNETTEKVDSTKTTKIPVDNPNAINIQSLAFYKTIYHIADSLNKIGNVGVLDSSIFVIADSLSNLEPSCYFLKTAELLKKLKFNEASFLYYLGYCRFKYYNSVDTNYRPDAGGALLASFKSMIGEPVQMYLRTYIDNYVSILNSSLNYYNKNDYAFCSRERDLEKYNHMAEYLTNNITQAKENKAMLIEKWVEERKQQEHKIDSLIFLDNSKH